VANALVSHQVDTEKKELTMRVSPWLLGVVVGCVAGSVNASANNEKSTQFLVFEIDVGKPTYALNEPVVLTYRLKNETEHVITSNATMSRNSGRLGITIKGPNGGAVPYPLPHADMIVPNRAHFPGEVLVSDVVLFWNREKALPAFPTVGNYQITASFLVRTSPRQLWLEGTTSVEITGATSVDQQLIAAVGSGKDVLDFLRKGASSYCGSESHPACFEDLKGLLDLFPTSSYSPMLCYHLVGALAGDTLRVEPQEALARQTGELCVSRWPDHPISPRTMEILIHFVRSSGDADAALTLIDTYEERWPERDEQASSFRAHVR
jgi:hypothetical protein